MISLNSIEEQALDMEKKLTDILTPYNPWWGGSGWKRTLPGYERPIVQQILSDLRDIPQAVSVTGPRRVGKTTAVHQVVAGLLDAGIPSNRVVYFSFDDPEVFASEELQHTIFDQLVRRMGDHGAPGYLFLDEIQRLPRWELFLKKYYDLRANVRFIASGSASSPIFRSSQESLLGRIKDRHLLPFSFREYCEYRLHGQVDLVSELSKFKDLKEFLLDGRGREAAESVMRLSKALKGCGVEIEKAVVDYCTEGGFPEVWSLPDPVRKIEYIMEQQVRKVLYEDLMMLTAYRKPENVLRFFVYLLGNPGLEINTASISQETGVERRIIEENLPRLELTDLILRIQKFTHQPLRVRKGNFKCYPIDMALRNAVMKTWAVPNATAIGYLAENLVLRQLIAWPERIEISFFREKAREVDFIVTYGGNRHLPIEVKPRKDATQLGALDLFMNRYKVDLGVVITRELQPRWDQRYLYLPLRYFLLAC